MLVSFSIQAHTQREEEGQGTQEARETWSTAEAGVIGFSTGK